MIKTPFYWSYEGNAIIVLGAINQKHVLRFLLDTGASNTSFDSNALGLISFQLKKPVERVLLETANGVISTDVYLIDSIDALGLSKKSFPVQILDFIARGITSEYDGIIGLDFLAGTHFCIDTVQQQITIN